MNEDGLDVIGHVFDTSIGVAQVRVTTALMLENKGYIEKSPRVIINGQEMISRWEEIVTRLMDNQTNTKYAAACLKYYQDRWRKKFPEIHGRTAILATLFNQGEKKPPHSNPSPNSIGNFAKNNHNHVRSLLGLN